MGKFVRNCLNRANSDKMSSINFPAIATGGLQYPPNVVGNIMVKEIKEFRDIYPKSKLRNITIICKPDDVQVIQVHITI